MARKPIEPDEFGNFTEKQLDKIKRRAWNVCVWYLEQRRYTRKQLNDKLVTRKIPEDIIEATLNRLEEEHRIDDYRYAEDYIESKRTYDKLGSQAIRFKLLQKGVDDSIITELLATLDQDELYETALILARKRLAQMKDIPEQKKLTRLVSMLGYKGYNGGVAFKVAKEVIQERKDSGIDDEEEETEY